MHMHKPEELKRLEYSFRKYMKFERNYERNCCILTINDKPIKYAHLYLEKCLLCWLFSSCALIMNR